MSQPEQSWTTRPEQAWTTRRTAPGMALSYWKDVICQNLLNMNIASRDESGFSRTYCKISLRSAQS